MVNHLKAQVTNLHFYYGAMHALKNISVSIHEKKVTAMIGPSGCGKTTLLRCFNRMHDLYPGNRYEGEIIMHPEGKNILEAREKAYNAMKLISIKYFTLIFIASIVRKNSISLALKTYRITCFLFG